MASGSSDRLNNSSSKGFDFTSDDNVLSDYANQEPSNGSHTDPVVGTCRTKDLQEGRQMTGSFVFPPENVFSSTEGSLNQEVVMTVERSMKKYADNLIHFLEGISSRLSQLELYCYNIDKSIGEMRSDLVHDHGEADSKLKSLEKHIKEVHRSVQLLTGNQELAQAQKEVAKLQLTQRDTSPQEEKDATSVDDYKKNHVLHTQLALPQQVAPLPSHPSRPVDPQQLLLPASQTAPQNTFQPSPYYLLSSQLPNPPTHSQPFQSPCIPDDKQFCGPQLVPAQGQLNQTSQAQLYPQYQEQWAQVPQSVQPQQPPLSQPHYQIRATSSALYSTFAPGQPKTVSPDTLASSMPMQVPFPGLYQPGAACSMTVPHGYSGAGRPVQPPPHSQQMKNSFSVHLGDRSSATGPQPPISSGGGYMIYDSDGARPHQSQLPTHFLPGGFAPTDPAHQYPHSPSSAGFAVRVPTPAHYVRNQPYNELIDKLAGMGYSADHVVSVIQRLEDGGQHVDFNAVLDGLNGHSSGGSQRA